MKGGVSVSVSRMLVGLILVLLLLGVGLAAAGTAEGSTGAVGIGVSDEISGVSALSQAASDADVDGSTTTFDSRTATAIDSRTAIDDTDTIRLQNGLFTTDEPGTVGVDTRVELPDRVTAFELTLLSSNDAAVDADGFEPAADSDSDEAVWAWDGETENPSLTYAMDVNDTVDEEGPLGTGGTYRFFDAGDWALVQTPRTAAAWSYTGEFSGQVKLERETVVDGEGVASRTLAFLGPHEEHVHEGIDGRYRLIVPEAADLAVTPAEVFGVFDGAATALRVGPPDDEVFAVAAPTGEVSWGVRGLQTGPADLWVRDEESVDTPDDVWTHEYVHTRQSYRAEASGRWITEATATYYAALFALERGAIDFDAFERTLARGEREPAASSVLGDPETWAENADYTKGSLVAGELDRHIRLTTDGGASLATVFRSLNDAGAPITNDDILDAVEAAVAEGADTDSAADIRAEAERLTATRAAPETWDRSAHAEAFGETPARVGYALTDDGVRVSGEYRDRPVDRGPIELVAGETLDLSVLVSNTGGTAGSYDLSLTVDAESVAERSGSVEPDAETVERFEHAFTEPGEYEVRIGGETLSVAVTDPAPVLVRDVATDPVAVTAGETVRAIATVANDAGIPAGADVEFRVDGAVVGTERVTLDANAETTVERDLRIDAGAGSGPVTVSVIGPVDEASTTVEVTGGGITGGAVPGFGPAVGVVALLSVGTALARRRSV